MNHKIRQATINDYVGINKIIQNVYGADDFISNQIMDWINNTYFNFPVVALDENSSEYLGFMNNRILGNCLWIEGLRISPDHRKENLATELVEHSISYALKNNIKILGFSTGDGNIPMHKIAVKRGFNLVGEQIVFNNRNPQTNSTIKETASKFTPILRKGISMVY